MGQIAERDWKVLRRIRDDALHRLSVRMLSGVRNMVSEVDLNGDAHSAFLSICRYVHDQNLELGDLFDDWRRSTAITTLMRWASAAIITEEEFADFSVETKELVRSMIEVKFYDEKKA